MLIVWFSLHSQSANQLQSESAKIIYSEAKELMFFT